MLNRRADSVDSEQPEVLGDTRAFSDFEEDTDMEPATDQGAGSSPTSVSELDVHERHQDLDHTVGELEQTPPAFHNPLFGHEADEKGM